MEQPTTFGKLYGFLMAFRGKMAWISGWVPPGIEGEGPRGRNGLNLWMGSLGHWGRRASRENAPFPAKSALFIDGCNFQCVSPCSSKHLKRHSFIAQNQKFFPDKKWFFATRKDVESYSQMPGKRILALEFSPARIFGRSLSGAAPPPAVPFFRGWPPFQKSWIRPWEWSSVVFPLDCVAISFPLQLGKVVLMHRIITSILAFRS
jgi:hypothetical protein